MRALALVLLIVVAGCATDVGPVGSAIAIRDPLGLIDDVYASGNQLRLHVLPAATYTCDSGTGAVSPEPAEVDVPDAIAEVTIPVTAMARSEIRIDPGDFVVLVRGRGDDMATMRRNVLIARGCARVDGLASGETREIRVMLAPVTVSGMCGDMLVSPDEQCEAPAPACAMCRTTVERVETTTMGMRTRARVSGRAGQRVVAAWDNNSFDPTFRLFSPRAEPLTGMAPLDIDTTLDDALTSGRLMNAQRDPDVAVAPNGRIAIAFVDASMAAMRGFDVRVAFFTTNRGNEGVPAQARMDGAMDQTAPSGAFSGTGAYLVAFLDPRAGTGLSGRAFAAGSLTPSGGEAFDLGSAGASAVRVAGLASGFVVAYAAGGNVHVQRVADDGTPMASMPAADPGPMRDQPAVAALDDGTTLVAWREMMGDDAGTGIRARIFTAAGAPAGAAFVVNTTTAGDQSAPAAAAASGRFFVAWESGGAIRARGVDATGGAVLSHEPMPSFNDVEIATGASAPALTAIDMGMGRGFWVLWQDGSGIGSRRYPL